jgi:hypothetical protein
MSREYLLHEREALILRIQEIDMQLMRLKEETMHYHGRELITIIEEMVYKCELVKPIECQRYTTSPKYFIPGSGFFVCLCKDKGIDFKYGPLFDFRKTILKDSRVTLGEPYSTRSSDIEELRIFKTKEQIMPFMTLIRVHVKELGLYCKIGHTEDLLKKFGQFT